MSALDGTFGAALVGLVAAACLFGITVLQAFNYFRNYTNDNWFMKLLVVILSLLDTLHLILCTRTVYWYLVTNFGDTANLDVITWTMAMQVDCNGLIGIMVELFFARRVWKMSRNWFIVGVIVILSSLHFGLGVVFTVQSFILGRFSKFRTLTWVTCLGLGSAAVCDMIIAISMCYYLSNIRTGVKRIDSVVTVLMVYSINSGLATSIVGLAVVICFAVMPDNFVWLSFFWIMGKCYVNSFLAILNSRDRLRDRVQLNMHDLPGHGQGEGDTLTFSPSSASAFSVPPLDARRASYSLSPDAPRVGPKSEIHRKSDAFGRMDAISEVIEIKNENEDSRAQMGEDDSDSNSTASTLFPQTPRMWAWA